MRAVVRVVVRLGRSLVPAARAWSADNCARLGAALSFYSAFSIAPILVIAIAVAGAVFGYEAARGRIVAELGGLIGHGTASTLETMIDSAYRSSASGLAAAIGAGTLVIGATYVLVELRDALNLIWRCEPRRQVLTAWVQARVSALALVLATGFLMLISLAVSAFVAAGAGWLAQHWPAAAIAARIGNIVVGLLVTTSLFAMLFRFVPDTTVPWRDAWLGAALTAVLFTIGRYAIGIYLGRSSVASAFGAAGSLAVMLLWIYYSAQIFLYGAEVTRELGRARTEGTAVAAPSAIAGAASPTAPRSTE